MEWTLNQASHDQINKTLDRLAITIKTLPIHLDTVWEPYQEILKEFHETASLIACLSAIDTSDARATAAEAKLNTIAAGDYNKG